MRTWRGVLAVEGKQTGDGRFIVEGAATWRPLPFALKPEHDTEGAVGNVAFVERVGGEIRATGVFDDQSGVGAELARQMDEGTAPLGNRWPLSIEPDDVQVEIVDTTAQIEDGTPAQDTIVASGSFHRREPIDADSMDNFLYSLHAASGDGEPQGVVVMEDSSDAIVARFTALRIAGVALTSVAAFAEAWIELDPSDTTQSDAPPPAPNAALLPVQASGRPYGAPVRPPVGWFQEAEPEDGDERLVPQYDIDTGAYLGDAVPLTITTDGQVYFHVAPKNRCHIGYADVCVTAPASASAYSHFNIGTIEISTDVGGAFFNGVGPVCCGPDHAAVDGVDLESAQDWYAAKALQWATVRVIPGRYGPWACGALCPDVTEELVVKLRGGGVSGDWRGNRGGLELIGLLAVNAPGFTVQRIAASAGDVLVRTAPVLANYPDVALQASASPCGCKDEQLMLLRRIDARTAAALNHTVKERMRARMMR